MDVHLHRCQGGSTVLGRQRLRLAELAESRGAQDVLSNVTPYLTSKTGLYTPTSTPHFLWVTEFPLFTRADADKDFLAKGRWSSSHHPFTAPAWQDVEALYAGRFNEVRLLPACLSPVSIRSEVAKLTLLEIRFAGSTTTSC